MSKRRKRSKSQRWRNSREWRICKIVVKKRDKVCQLCGDRKRREVHHIKDASYHKELRTDPNNCILLCMKCHRPMFHILYKGGYRKKTTEKDLYKFMTMAKYYMKLGKEEKKVE